MSMINNCARCGGTHSGPCLDAMAGPLTHQPDEQGRIRQAVSDALQRASSEVAHEPVAWANYDSDGDLVNVALDMYCTVGVRKEWIEAGYRSVPLYHAPVASVPVAELEKLAKTWDDWADTHLDGVELEIAVKCHRDLRALIDGRKA